MKSPVMTEAVQLHSRFPGCVSRLIHMTDDHNYHQGHHTAPAERGVHYNLDSMVVNKCVDFTPT